VEISKGNPMKGKGKLIGKVGQVCFLLEDVGHGEYFRVALVDANNEVVAATNINLIDALWLAKCIDRTINSLFDENIKQSWSEETE
jgi:hypothetical protein